MTRSDLVSGAPVTARNTRTCGVILAASRKAATGMWCADTVHGDPIFSAFLERQRMDAAALTRDSDLVEIRPLAGLPDGRFHVRLRCKGLVRDAAGRIVEADRFDVGVWFPSDYLRRANPFEVLVWLGPWNVFHPNISDAAPFVCIGRLTRGTTLVEIAYRLFDLVTWNNVTMVESDALNRAACAWARQNRDRFPVDRRPLMRRQIQFTTAPPEAARADV